VFSFCTSAFSRPMPTLRQYHACIVCICLPIILIIGLCILMRVYQLNIGITSVRNKVFFSARFYCALLTLHVSTPFGSHLQVVRKRKKYPRQSLYIQRIRWVGMYKVNIVVR
jgi:uncharacterized membrane protein